MLSLMCVPAIHVWHLVKPKSKWTNLKHSAPQLICLYTVTLCCWSCPLLWEHKWACLEWSLRLWISSACFSNKSPASLASRLSQEGNLPFHFLIPVFLVLYSGDSPMALPFQSSPSLSCIFSHILHHVCPFSGQTYPGLSILMREALHPSSLFALHAAYYILFSFLSQKGFLKIQSFFM